MKDHLKEREIIDVAKKKSRFAFRKQVSGASSFDGGRLEKRIGGSAYLRNGVWGSKTAFRPGYIDQEASTKLMTLCTRPPADPPILFPLRNGALARYGPVSTPTTFWLVRIEAAQGLR